MLSKFRCLLIKHNISLRHVFSEYRIGTMHLTKEQFLNAFDKDDIKILASDIFDQYCVNSIASTVSTVMDLTTFFEKIETRKSFVFIVPSYNNIDNYMINLTSIKRQCSSYPRYQFRTIYVLDVSTDGTGNAVKKYIQDNRFENCIEFLEMKKRQRQGMGRYTAFHRCFDDEICVNLDGDDWLYDDFVLENLEKHYISKNILVSYGCYYSYDRRCLRVGKSMMIPYNNILFGTMYFPDRVKRSKLFRNGPWISAHLRSAYAKLFKSIELRHFIDHEGNFFKMVTDGCEMYPVLEMSLMRNSNIARPMMVYNRYNSELYDTSFYKNIDPSNEYNNDYRKKVTKLIKNREYYSNICKGDETIKLEKLVPTISEIDINKLKKDTISQIIHTLELNKSDYILLNNNNSKEDNKYAMILINSIYLSQPGVVLLDSINSVNPVNLDNIQSGASLELFNRYDPNNVYYAVKMFFDIFGQHENKKLMDLSKITPGFYNRKKFISILNNDQKMLNEVALIHISYYNDKEKLK